MASDAMTNPEQPDTRPRPRCAACGQPLAEENWHHAPPTEPPCAKCLDHVFKWPTPDTEQEPR